MRVVSVDGRVRVDLTLEDCALLARACEYTAASSFVGQDNEMEGGYIETLGSGFRALVLSGAAAMHMYAEQAVHWRQALDDLGIQTETGV